MFEHLFFLGIDTFSGYELAPLSKSMAPSIMESQVWSSPRYITTPSSISPLNHACPCGSTLKDEFHLNHDEQKHFIARLWIYDEMLKLLKSTSKPGLVLLSRTPGMGKTCLMKNLLPSNTSLQSMPSMMIRNDSGISSVDFIHGFRYDRMLLFSF